MIKIDVMPLYKKLSSLHWENHRKRHAVNKNLLVVNEKSSGVSLVEILLSVFFVISLVGILFTASGSQLTRRSSNLESIASKIATQAIENLRGSSFNNLSGDLDCTGGITTPILTTLTETQYPQLSQLNEHNATRIVSCFDELGTYYDNIRNVQVQINWKSGSGADRNIFIDTLIYEEGI